MNDIDKVRERLERALLAGMDPAFVDDVDALLDEHARLQRLEAALASWSLAVNDNGTVGVVGLRDDSPGGDIAIANKGRLEQRLLYALVTDSVVARKAVQP